MEHYTSRGEVELIPLSLPEHQPNLPGLQHLYLQGKLINKRQNELGESFSSSKIFFFQIFIKIEIDFIEEENNTFQCLTMTAFTGETSGKN